MPKKKSNKKEEQNFCPSGDGENRKVCRFLKSCFRGRNLVVTLLVLLFLFQYIQTYRVLGDFSLLRGHSSSLIDEIGSMKETHLRIGEDLNEVRSFLRMPVNQYGMIDEIGVEIDEDANTNELQLAVFQYVDHLSYEISKDEVFSSSRALLSSLKNSETLKAFLEERNLRFSNLFETEKELILKIFDEDDREIVVYNYSSADKSLFFEPLGRKENITNESVESLEKKTIDFILNEKSALMSDLLKLENKREEVKAAIASEEVSKIMSAKNINIDENFVITTDSGTMLGEIELNTESGRIGLIDFNNEDLSLEVSDIKKSLAPFLSKLDARSPIEKRVDEAKRDIEDTIADGGFEILLSQNNLKISSSPREDNFRYYYDIFVKNGEAVSSLAIEKSTGIVYVTNPDGTNAQNIFFFEPESKKKTLEIPDDVPDYGSIFDDRNTEGTLNILVAGSHGALLDAMMLVHINERRGDVRIVSIPRDLFYNGRKINAFAHFYGLDELMRVVGNITGYTPDRYISIDMYAFIDVIDLIGGVEVTLDRAVIDPTYRTVDNGRVGTLHYQPGTYYFSGVEALRLARSRYTSSDFARAERQHLILRGIQKKASNFGFGDADTIYQIVRTILSKTDTNISIDEAIVWFFRYQDYEVTNSAVMSSGNVLYVPPYITAANCKRMIEEAEAEGEPIPDCENENQAYTLLPRDNNWNVIKWFFREIFED